MVKFSKRVIREKMSSRGGGVEISLQGLNKNKYDRYCKMTAFQNYLGGGILSCISNDCNIRDWEEDEYLVNLSKKLSEYFYSRMEEQFDMEYNSFEEVQLRPSSAY